MGAHNVKFADIENQVNPELQDKLHRAQDEVNEKKAQVEGLEELVRKAVSALKNNKETLPPLRRKCGLRTKATALTLNVTVTKVRSAVQHLENNGFEVLRGAKRETHKSSGKCAYTIPDVHL